MVSIKGNDLKSFIIGEHECPEQLISSKNSNGAEDSNNNKARASIESISINPEFNHDWLSTSMFISQCQARIQTLGV